MPLVLTNRRRRGGSASAPAFSPSTLYSSGSQGIWLDPSDLSTMFSDRAGTTPVTTPGTVVGLRLDKSKGLALGSELVVNGTFPVDTAGPTVTGWTANGSGPSTASVSGGNFLVTTSTGTGYGRQGQVLTLTVGVTYKITATARVVSGTSPNAFFYVGPNSGGFGANKTLTNNTTSARSYTGFFTATQTTNYLVVGDDTAATNAVTEFDNISVRELPGNHAVAPTDAARPTYGVEPKGGRRNLLTWSEDFRNTAAAGETRPWAYTNVTIPTTNNTAPNGTATADTLAETAATGEHRVSIPTAVVLGQTYTYSVYVAPAGRDFAAISGTSTGWGGGRLTIYNLTNNTVPTLGSGVSATISDAPNGFKRLTWTVSPLATASTDVSLFAALNGTTVNYAGDITKGLLVWGAQFEVSSAVTNYQRVLSAYDITESGVATTHYVQYDGSDDSMSTAAIDFTGTDKMSVFAGVLKSSNALTGMLFGFSTGVVNGSINLTIPQVTATGVMRSNSRGTVTSYVDGPSQAAPASFLATLQSDISGDNLLLRLDGTQVAQSTTDQGTGNFGNYPLHIGRRGGTDQPFNGRDYGIIVVGKAASAGEITDTETWLAARTAQVTL